MEEDLTLIESRRFPLSMWCRDSTDEFILREVMDADTYKLSTLPPINGTVLDIGANIGAFSVLANHLWPTTTVYAFEPIASNHALAVKNRAANGLSIEKAEALTFHAAVWEHNEGVNIGGTRGGGHVADLGTTTPVAEQESVDSVTFDQIADHFEVIDLLKIDTEGAEVEMMLAASPESMRKVQRIMGEFHGNGGGRSALWGEWVRWLCAFMPVTFEAHPYPNHPYGGMFWGSRA